MCQIVYTELGEEIETPRQFKEHFGFDAEKCEYYNTVDPDSCLCQCDLDITFVKHHILFRIETGDYYVLDNCLN